jgi:hypothetical protein
LKFECLKNEFEKEKKIKRKKKKTLSSPSLSHSLSSISARVWPTGLFFFFPASRPAQPAQPVTPPAQLRLPPFSFSAGR